jgi:RNA polymerase sigma-70 factor (ECF subfamily)
LQHEAPVRARQDSETEKNCRYSGQLTRIPTALKILFGLSDKIAALRGHKHVSLLRKAAWKISSGLDPVGALEGLFRDYHRALFRYAVSLTARRALAEDAVQEVFLQLAGDLSRLRQIDEPRCYLYRAVRNQIMKAQSRSGNSWEELDQVEMFPCPDLSPEQRVSLVMALAVLPHEQREVIFLKETLQLSFREIADITGVGLNTVASRHRYALERLRKELEVEKERPLYANAR